jgi:predicted PurR-regulated permease PerM
MSDSSPPHGHAGGTPPAPHGRDGGIPHVPPRGPSAPDGFRRIALIVGALAAGVVAYLLRGVLVPLFFAFLVAYALDPFVDRLEEMRIPRPAGALIVMAGILAFLVTVTVYAIPLFVDEVRSAAAELPTQMKSLEARAEPWLYSSFKIKLPHTMSDVLKTVGERLQGEIPGTLSTAALALFGTLSYVAVALSALIVPVFALYLLIDFDRIVAKVGDLIPRRWHKSVASVAREVHKTLGSYIRGQVTANIILAALYATGLRLVGIRLAVPIGVLTGMLAFVPYLGFSLGLVLAMAMALLDWQGVGTLLGVVVVMGCVQLLDGMVITPRIVGRSVGLAPLEVLLTMMAAASLFGFFGVLLAVPLGAVVKILVRRSVKAYMESAFYAQIDGPTGTSGARSPP